MADPAKEKARAAAQKYLQKGQLAKAIAAYATMLEDNPKDTQVLLRVAELQGRNGDKVAAIATYERVADVFEAGGFLVKAVAAYKQILTLDPGLIDVHRRLAGVFQRMGLTPDAVAQLALLSEIFARLERRQEARDALEEVLRLDPSNVPCHVRLADLYSGDGLIKEATLQLHEALGILKEQGDDERYIQVADRVLRLDGEDQSTAMELARRHLTRGDPRKALANLQLCFKVNPRNVATMELLAEVFTGLGQQDKVLAVYHDILSIHQEQKNRAAAIKTARAILELDKDSEPATAALRITRKAPEHVPAPQAPLSPAKQLQEVDVFLKYGLLDRARDQVEAMLEQDPLSRHINGKYKEVLLALGDTEEAVACLVAMARTAIERHNETGAKANLREAIAIVPGHAEAAQLLRTLGGDAREAGVVAREPSVQNLPADTAPYLVARGPGEDLLAAAIETMTNQGSAETHVEAMTLAPDPRTRARDDDDDEAMEFDASMLADDDALEFDASMLADDEAMEIDLSSVDEETHRVTAVPDLRALDDLFDLAALQVIATIDMPRSSPGP
jgi:tetratricopeptide (TPR) repeat protein